MQKPAVNIRSAVQNAISKRKDFSFCKGQFPDFTFPGTVFCFTGKETKSQKIVKVHMFTASKTKHIFDFFFFRLAISQVLCLNRVDDVCMGYGLPGFVRVNRNMDGG